MNKYKIIALFGPAGSGKDYLQKQLMQMESLRDSIYEIISYTTRPPREGELDGVNYHFIDTETFVQKIYNNQMLEYAEFRSWFYGTGIDSLKEDKVNIGVFNIQGIQKLMQNKRINCTPIYIKATDKLRLIRQLEREKNPDCNEIVRRFLTDKKDFEKITFDYLTIENEIDNNKETLEDIYYIIKEVERSK